MIGCLANVEILFVEAVLFCWCRRVLLPGVRTETWVFCRLLLVASIGCWPHFACRPAGQQLSVQLQLIKPCAGNNVSGHTQTRPGSTASERLSSGCVFVCIVVSAKFVRVPFLLVVPDIKRNTIRGALFVLPEATFPSFWRFRCSFSFSRPISFRYRLFTVCYHQCNICRYVLHPRQYTPLDKTVDWLQA